METPAEVTYIIMYERHVVRSDIPALPYKEGREIQKAIDMKLRIKPQIFGKPLRGSLKNHWSLRVGKYRVIYKIVGDCVYIFSIEHRSNVYTGVEKRLP